MIEQVLRKKFIKPDEVKINPIKEIISDVKSLTFRDKEFPSPPWYLIPFNNGIYNLMAKEFREFLPSDNLTAKLAVNYDPESPGCPFIDKTFHELVRPEDVSDLYELMAYCMVPSYANQEFYFLFGSGRNGKSVYAQTIFRLLGQENVSTVSLHNIQSNRFACAELHGKFANICAELRYGNLRNTDLIKQLTGGDYIQAERKFMSPFSFRNYAKLIFITNELPPTTDKTQAFYRRVRIIEFPYTFVGNTEDKLLLDKITVQELEGLAFNCVAVLESMMARNFSFTKQEATSKTEQHYEKVSNPIDTFIAENCDQDADTFITKEDFKVKLDGWIRDNGIRIRDDKEILQRMKEKGIDDQKKTWGGVRKNSWIGIKWK
ncbi:MAG: hypothetical protein JW902_12860 [Syntrophaceae bacterium]|nr:hypothetical protein [Syntrophaceae bacterium]